MASAQQRLLGPHPLSTPTSRSEVTYIESGGAFAARQARVARLSLQGRRGSRSRFGVSDPPLQVPLLCQELTFMPSKPSTPRLPFSPCGTWQESEVRGQGLEVGVTGQPPPGSHYTHLVALGSPGALWTGERRITGCLSLQPPEIAPPPSTLQSCDRVRARLSLRRSRWSGLRSWAALQWPLSRRGHTGARFHSRCWRFLTHLLSAGALLSLWTEAGVRSSCDPGRKDAGGHGHVPSSPGSRRVRGLRAAPGTERELGWSITAHSAGPGWKVPEGEAQAGGLQVSMLTGLCTLRPGV